MRFSLLLFNGTRGELTQTIDGDRRAVGLSKSENRFVAFTAPQSDENFSLLKLLSSQPEWCCHFSVHSDAYRSVSVGSKLPKPEMSNVKVGWKYGSHRSRLHAGAEKLDARAVEAFSRRFATRDTCTTVV